MTIALCGDIGGTNANFAIVHFNDNETDITLEAEECTPCHDRFEDALQQYLAKVRELGCEPTIACFAVAGPLREQRVEMPNTGLVIDAKRIVQETALEQVLLINDFAAIGYATNVLHEDDYIVVNTGDTQPGHNKAVIGAGTGLGKTILVYNEEKGTYEPRSSEGGHADLPLFNETELALADGLRAQREETGPVKWEDVLSGRGLERIYHYLQYRKYPYQPTELTAADIAQSCDTNPCSKEAFDWFVAFYARCGRNFVLETFATAGLYIAGGIAAKNTKAFEQFMNYFTYTASAQYQHVLQRVPVHLITNYAVSIKGAAVALQDHKYVRTGDV